ncbi:protein-tyrosine-phosphatase MKP1-like [Primulina huaijiensis]|uniref:protein-tyrosine-phosphatase MKP1-like n=1 Tax=Primulina huaijiensis TaxID=1492673 RepID=UPI003CC71B90
MDEEKEQSPGESWKTYSRSVSWTERPPRKSNSKPQWNSKARACLPPLQPLSIIRPSLEEWPKAGSDDLGIWPNPPTPGVRPGSATPRENSASDKHPREFDFRKDKLAFFEKECSRILDHIYLGSDVVAKNREILRQNWITHVLNCVGFVCPEYFKNELVYKTLWLHDCPSEDITSILYDVFDYFEDVREQGKRVLVHCCQGVSRSNSLVIAYLMWKEGLSFDDAFQHVKAARGVTNPNVGFACQLLQCQKRVHALPASPTSVLRMYLMAPHSPYDPLHLVPKILCEPSEQKLDSRGAFIIHIPCALYVWTGKHCSPVMSDNAMAAASQVIRYERAQGPVITLKEGEETFEFWDALGYCSVKSEKESMPVESDMVPAAAHPPVGQRKLPEYDLDFEIFDRALSGGVLPPCPLLEAGSETHLPARENGWNRLRRKFASGVVKEFITSSKINSSGFSEHDLDFEISHRALPIEVAPSYPLLEAGSETCLPARGNGWNRLRRNLESGILKKYITSSKVNHSASQVSNGLYSIDTCEEVEDFVSASDASVCSNSQCDSPDSFVSYVTSSPGWSKSNLKEVGFPAPLSEIALSRSPSFNLVDSFSSFLVSKSKSCSPSPALSPATSDYSSSFTFSPSSSNWSDLTFVSAQPSPNGLESRDAAPGRRGPVEETVSVGKSVCSIYNVALSPPEEEISPSRVPKVSGPCSSCGETFPSLSEHMCSHFPSRMILPSSAEVSHNTENLTSYMGNDVLKDVECNSFNSDVSSERERKRPISDANGYVPYDEF